MNDLVKNGLPRLALLATFCLVGCVDSYVGSLELRQPAPAQMIEGYLARHPGIEDETKAMMREGIIKVGMPLDCVVAACGDTLDRYSAGVWRIKRQFEYVVWLLPPYPMIFMQDAYLYWENDVLVAIIIRGVFTGPYP